MIKLILGVMHRDGEELNKVINMVDSYLNEGLRNIGIELPTDYLNREYGIRTFFFGDIAEYFRKKGINIIPLENPETWDEYHSLGIVEQVMKNEISKEEIKAYIRETEITPYLPPEEVYYRWILNKRFKKALEVLNKISSLEDLEKLAEFLINEREEKMLEKINEYKPDLILVGDGHAQKIKQKLPEYEYKRGY